MPQPYFVPVMPRMSRSTQSSGTSSAASNILSWPLIFRTAIEVPPQKCSVFLRVAPPNERDGERNNCQQDDADTVEVRCARQTEGGCEEACRELGKTEGKIALHEIG